MKKTIFMEKYPIYTLELKKTEIAEKSVAEIIEYFKKQIETHPIAKFIAIFDHYSHTQNINGEINESILDVQNILFCFGTAIPDTKMVAVRPRSIGVCELENSFVIEFMEVPKEELNVVLENWSKELMLK
ncbi:hypothetical protein ALC152_12140 [Arcobacter sp. 15-2]|uniref:DUF6858 family protein n=1 Tax=Arcobacter sp. 15-2 TaxID=3374109 RepID=UPI00399CA9EF